MAAPVRLLGLAGTNRLVLAVTNIDQAVGSKRSASTGPRPACLLLLTPRATLLPNSRRIHVFRRIFQPSGASFGVRTFSDHRTSGGLPIRPEEIEEQWQSQAKAEMQQVLEEENQPPGEDP
jgi:hypothetical protein